MLMTTHQSAQCSRTGSWLSSSSPTTSSKVTAEEKLFEISNCPFCAKQTIKRSDCRRRCGRSHEHSTDRVFVSEKCHAVFMFYCFALFELGRWRVAWRCNAAFTVRRFGALDAKSRLRAQLNWPFRGPNQLV